MRLIKRLHAWWLRLTRWLYLRAGGEIYECCTVMLPANCVELKDELKFHYRSEEERQYCIGSVKMQLADRLGAKMIEEGLVHFEIYDQKPYSRPQDPFGEIDIEARVLALHNFENR